MFQSFIIPLEAMGKPRMTRADKWRKRDCVVRYREYADRLRAACRGVMTDPTEVSWRAFFAFPASYSKKKRAELAGTAHREKPDRDNIDKGILDALWDSDKGIASGFLGKFWDDGNGARIELFISTADRVSTLLESALSRHPDQRAVLAVRKDGRATPSAGSLSDFF